MNAKAPVRSDMHAAPHGDAHKDCTVHRCINNRAMMHTEGQGTAKGLALHDSPPPPEPVPLSCSHGCDVPVRC